MYFILKLNKNKLKNVFKKDDMLSVELKFYTDKNIKDIFIKIINVMYRKKMLSKGKQLILSFIDFYSPYQ